MNPPDVHPAPPTRRRRRVTQPLRGHALVAEHDDASRCAVSGALRALGYEVSAVRTGASLLAYVGSSLVRRGGVRKLDLLVADADLPGARGLALLASLRRNGWDVPLIVTADAADVGARQRAEQLGAVALLVRPVDLEDLARYTRTSGPPTVTAQKQRHGGWSPRPAVGVRPPVRGGRP